MAAVTDTVLDALNAHDIEAFLECYTEDARIESDDEGILADGQEAIRLRYTELFGRFPNLSVRGIRCIETASYAVQEEEVIGRGSEPERHIAVYRIQEGLIAHERLLRDTPQQPDIAGGNAS